MNNIPKVAICSLVKNTPDYLMKEWINHHFNLGVSNIFVYIDKNSYPIYKDDRVTYIQINDNDISILEEEGKKYILKVEDFAITKQLGLYNIFLENNRNNFDWIAFIDDDEFLEIDLSILNNHTEETCIVLPWKMMFSNRIKCDFTLNDYEEYPPILKYAGSSKFVKSIVNTKKIWKIRCIHYGDFTNEILGTENIVTKLDYTTEDQILDIFKNSKYYVKHYKIRSLDEWIESIINRGYFINRRFPNNRWDRTIKNYFLQNPLFDHLGDDDSNDFIKTVLIESGYEYILETPYFPEAKIPEYPEITGSFKIIYNYGLSQLQSEVINKLVKKEEDYIIIDYFISNSILYKIDNLSDSSIILNKNTIMLLMINEYERKSSENIDEIETLTIVLQQMFPNAKFI